MNTACTVPQGTAQRFDHAARIDVDEGTELFRSYLAALKRSDLSGANEPRKRIESRCGIALFWWPARAGEVAGVA